MREILFRGKDKFDGEWYAGSLSHDTKYGNCFIEVSVHQGITKEVIPETVGQFTGLTDKNGKRIFEGDIVNVENALVRGIFAVEYCGISACFIVSHGERRYFLGGCNCKIIGNIHDNPELLKE